MQISPSLSTLNVLSIKEAIEADKQIQNIKQQIEALTKRMDKEPSSAKRQELARERYELKLKL